MQEDTNVPATGMPPEVLQAAQILAGKHNNGSGWFTWIAGLSLVNSAVILLGSTWSFLIGLGATQIIDGFAMAAAENIEAPAKTIILAVAFLIDLIIAGSFFLWGMLARRGHRWAYIVGIVLYSLDGLIFLVFQDFPSLGFHIFALYYLVNGFRACGQLKQLIAAYPNLASGQ